MTATTQNDKTEFVDVRAGIVETMRVVTDLYARWPTGNVDDLTGTLRWLVERLEQFGNTSAPPSASYLARYVQELNARRRADEALVDEDE